LGIRSDGKIYLWEFQRDQKSGQYVLPLSGALIAKRARAHARKRVSFAPDGKKAEKREAYRVERNRKFIQNSPMTVGHSQGHILCWTERTCGPDKLLVSTAGKVAPGILVSEQ
jgi:hypothetical protein